MTLTAPFSAFLFLSLLRMRQQVRLHRACRNRRPERPDRSIGTIAEPQLEVHEEVGSVQQHQDDSTWV